MSQLARQSDAALPDGVALQLTTPSRLAPWCELVKARITAMVAITAFVGYALGIAATPDLRWPWLELFAMLAGVSCSCMGAAVLNQIYERDTDALMRRTCHRPLPAGRIGVREALLGGLLLCLAGVAMLLLTHWVAAAVSLFTMLSYALIYTPLKRVTVWNTWVGAVPGALPPVIGYAAATGKLGLAGWLIFAIMAVWQVPHFLAICWLYREDYARADLKMLPVLDGVDGRRTFTQIFWGCLILLPLGLLPTLLGVSGWLYFAAALGCGLAFLGFGINLIRRRTRPAARRLFFASLAYLPVVLIFMLIDRVS
jgi:protoheme IX farnesyltransferase